MDANAVKKYKKIAYINNKGALAPLIFHMSQPDKAFLRKLWMDQAEPEAWGLLAKELNPPLEEEDWQQRWDPQLWERPFSNVLKIFLKICMNWRMEYVASLANRI